MGVDVRRLELRDDDDRIGVLCRVQRDSDRVGEERVKLFCFRAEAHPDVAAWEREKAAEGSDAERDQKIAKLLGKLELQERSRRREIGLVGRARDDDDVVIFCVRPARDRPGGKTRETDDEHASELEVDEGPMHVARPALDRAEQTVETRRVDPEDTRARCVDLDAGASRLERGEDLVAHRDELALGHRMGAQITRELKRARVTHSFAHPKLARALVDPKDLGLRVIFFDHRERPLAPLRMCAREDLQGQGGNIETSDLHGIPSGPVQLSGPAKVWRVPRLSLRISVTTR